MLSELLTCAVVELSVGRVKIKRSELVDGVGMSFVSVNGPGGGVSGAASIASRIGQKPFVICKVDASRGHVTGRGVVSSPSCGGESGCISRCFGISASNVKGCLDKSGSSGLIGMAAGAEGP
jgi:hypothetical protein